MTTKHPYSVHVVHAVAKTLHARCHPEDSRWEYGSKSAFVRFVDDAHHILQTVWAATQIDSAHEQRTNNLIAYLEYAEGDQYEAIWKEINKRLGIAE